MGSMMTAGFMYGRKKQVAEQPLTPSEKLKSAVNTTFHAEELNRELRDLTFRSTFNFTRYFPAYREINPTRAQERHLFNAEEMAALEEAGSGVAALNSVVYGLGSVTVRPVEETTGLIQGFAKAKGASESDTDYLVKQSVEFRDLLLENCGGMRYRLGSLDSGLKNLMQLEARHATNLIEIIPDASRKDNETAAIGAGAPAIVGTAITYVAFINSNPIVFIAGQAVTWGGFMRVLLKRQRGQMREEAQRINAQSWEALRQEFGSREVREAITEAVVELPKEYADLNREERKFTGKTLTCEISESVNLKEHEAAHPKTPLFSIISTNPTASSAIVFEDFEYRVNLGGGRAEVYNLFDGAYVPHDSMVVPTAEKRYTNEEFFGDVYRKATPVSVTETNFGSSHWYAKPLQIARRVV